jgi:hypothetical protein
MNNNAEVLSDIAVPFHISEFPPCEIYVTRPLDTDDLAQREISFADPRKEKAGQLVQISPSNATVYRLDPLDFDLLVAGIDEVKVSFGTYRRKEFPGNIKSRGMVKEYRGHSRPVEIWIYETVN